VSRYSDDYDFDSNYCYLWESRVNQVIRGKRGQRMLREFIYALLELPERRLIAGHIVKNGEVCAVGALAKKRGVLESCNESCDHDASDTARLGESLGLTYTLAWEIGYLNDVECPAPEKPMARRVKLDVPLIEEPDPRARYYGGNSRMMMPTEVREVWVRDYNGAFVDGYSPEQRWQKLYEWACSKVRWDLPVVVA
jgi:hypothetical protein